MNLNQYRKSFSAKTANLRNRTITFLLKENKVLLGKRKEGMGSSLYVGIGGKQREDEKLTDTAVREIDEEIGVSIKPSNLTQIAQLTFLFLDKSEYNQRVFAFLCEDWEREPTESREIIPEWFDVNDIPYEQMWEDAKFYMPYILQKKKVEAAFLYKGEKVIDYTLVIK